MTGSGKSYLADLRVSYDRGQLGEAELAPTPLEQFRTWLDEATAAGVPEPNAMVLATVDGQGEPSTRTVLLKGVEPGGFTFFTNYGSTKSRAIDSNPRVSLCFPWIAMHRQVVVSGTAERLSRDANEDYFRTRPWDSQIAAWASRQSEEVANRDVLDRRFAATARRWPPGSEPDAPEFWGGFLVSARAVEFWAGRESRLHDRLLFVATGESRALDDPAGWTVRRLYP